MLMVSLMLLLMLILMLIWGLVRFKHLICILRLIWDSILGLLLMLLWVGNPIIVLNLMSPLNLMLVLMLMLMLMLMLISMLIPMLMIICVWI